MKKITLLLMGLFLLLFAARVDAQGRRDDWDGGIRSRVREARVDIERGIRSGLLTRREASRLEAELDHILRRIDRMKRDGRLDRREREVVHNDLDRLERDIRREKRDDDRRGGDRDDRWGNDWDGGIRSRVREARVDIARGMRSGMLTRREASRLEAELDHIRRRMDRMKRDGRLDRRERDAVHSDLDRLERDIRREKHDRERRRH